MLRCFAEGDVSKHVLRVSLNQPSPLRTLAMPANGRFSMKASAPVYIFDPAEKPSLPAVDVPLIVATDESVREYGCLVDDPASFQIEIVRWPAQGWRRVDEGTGDEAGFVEGTFHGEWKGNVLYGSNEAVGGHYVLGWSKSRSKKNGFMSKGLAWSGV